MKKVQIVGTPIRQRYPGGEDTYITAYLPGEPRIGDVLQFNFDDFPPLTIVSRTWIYNPETQKWFLKCQVDNA